MGFDLKAEVAKLNAELKAGRVRVAVRVKGDRLYLRATLPPKPGSPQQEYSQQEISLGVYANPAGLKRAKAEALQISSDVALGRFDWTKYIKTKPSKQTTGDWIKAFEEDYFQRRARSPKSETTWDKDYRLPFTKLSPDRPLTAEVMLEAIAQTKPDTRSRQRVCNAYAALARLAGIELDTSKLRGSYSPKAVEPRDLPSDELILEWRDRIEHDGWKWVYSVIAAYGLRPHEAFNLDLDGIREGKAVKVLDGKTGFHLALPCLAEWRVDWALWDVTVPNVTAKCNRDYGLRASQYMRRIGLPFKLYDLRHAWAARAARLGMADTIAAKLQGHSPQIHNAVYQRFMDESHLLAAWEITVGRTKQSALEEDDD